MSTTTTVPVVAAELVDQLLTRMLWSRRAATLARAHVPEHMYAGRAVLAALIADHDDQHPHAPADGADRVASIVDHVLTHRADVDRARDARHRWATTAKRAGAQPFDPYAPAVALAARAHGRPDPTLLARASSALTYLPTLAAPPVPGPACPTASLIRRLRTARAHDDLTRHPRRTP